MKKTLLTIIVQEGQCDFVVHHWYADSDAVTDEMTRWLTEATTDNYDDLPAHIRGFLWDTDFEDEENEETDAFKRGKELGGIWTKKRTTMSFEDTNAAYTAVFSFY